MSTPAPELHPDLDDQLNVALKDTQAAASSGAFQVTTLEHANWAVRKIAQHRAVLAESEALYDTERARLDAWRADQQARCADACEFLGGLLRRFHEDRLVDDPKAKTIRLPAGDLVARKAPDRIDVDLDAFVPWAQATGRDDLLRVKVEPDKPAIRQAVGDVMEDGRVVHGDTGEFMPGVTWIDGDVRFSVNTPKAGR